MRQHQNPLPHRDVRNPAYPWLLSWLYDPAMSPDEFFEIGKRWNIRLSYVLVAGYAAIAARALPPLVAINFVLTLAFGVYMFKTRPRRMTISISRRS